MRYKFETFWYNGILAIGVLIAILVAFWIWEMKMTGEYYSDLIHFPEITFMSRYGLVTLWFVIGALEVPCVFIYFEMCTCVPIMIVSFLYIVSLMAVAYGIYNLRAYWFVQEVVRKFIDALTEEVASTKMVPIQIRHYQQSQKCCLMFESVEVNQYDWIEALPEERTVRVHTFVRYPFSCCSDFYICQRVSEGLNLRPDDDLTALIFEKRCQEPLEDYFRHYMLYFQTHLWFCVFVILLSFAIYLFYVEISGPEHQARGKRVSLIKHAHPRLTQPAVGHAHPALTSPVASESSIRSGSSGEPVDRDESSTFVSESYKGFKWSTLVRNTRRTIRHADEVLTRRRRHEYMEHTANENEHERPPERVYLLQLGNLKY